MIMGYGNTLGMLGKEGPKELHACTMKCHLESHKESGRLIGGKVLREV